MTSFDKTKSQFLQNLYFHTSELAFVLCCIPSFDKKMDFMKKNVDETPFIQRWNHSTCFIFETLITEHQDRLPLICMERKIICNSVNNEAYFNFMSDV